MFIKGSQFGAIGLAAALVGLAPAAPSASAGVDQETNIDGFDPAAENFRINEARRLNAISRQLELKYRMLWWYGFDPANPPVDQPVGHASEQVGPNKWIYRPVYPDEVPPEGEVIEAAPELLPTPAAQVPPPAPASGPTIVPALPGVQHPAPSDARPSDRLIPRKPAKSRGPREF